MSTSTAVLAPPCSPLPLSSSPAGLEQQPEILQHTTRSTTVDTKLRAPLASNTKSRAAHLHNSIARVEAQIQETQKKLEETCEELQVKTGDVLLQPSSQLSNITTSTSESLPKSTNGCDANAVSDTEVIKHARKTVSEHIRLLNRYNELKDVSMALLSMIAEAEGKRMQDVMEERGVEDD